MRPHTIRSTCPAVAMSRPIHMPLAGISRRKTSVLALAVVAAGVALAGPPAIRGHARDTPDIAGADTVPRVFAEGVISTVDDETNLSFSPDGETVYFTKRSMWGGVSVICLSHRAGGQWQTPEIASFSGRYRDTDPFVSPDGTQLYFASSRPVPGMVKAGASLWVTDRTPNGEWSEPRPLPAPILSAASDLYPVVTADHSLYFSSQRPGGVGPISVWRAQWDRDHFAAPVLVGGGINSPSGAMHAYVSPHERYMVFVSFGRPDELVTEAGIYRHGDLYISERQDSVWQPARHFGEPINSAAAERAPSVSPDGRHFYFTSARGFATRHPPQAIAIDQLEAGLHSTANGLGNIFETGIAALHLHGSPDIATVTSPAQTPYRLCIHHLPQWLTTRLPWTVAGCSRMPVIAAADRPLDGVAHADSAATRAPGGLAMLGPGVISTDDDEYAGAITPDGTTIYYNKSVPTSNQYVIVVSHLTDGHWSAPQVAPFSGRYSDTDPVLSPDGRTLYWASDRPVGGTIKHDYDIWKAEQISGGGWGPPEHLSAPINSDRNEYIASVTRDGTMYFSSARDGGELGTVDIYRSRLVNGRYQPPENLHRALNGSRVSYYDLDAVVSPDERTLVVSSFGRPGGLGSADMYVSHRDAHGRWSRLRHLGPPINSSDRDYSPRFAPDGRHLIFSSERGFAPESIAAPLDYPALVARLRQPANGSGNIYEIDARMLDSLAEPVAAGQP
jgi:hypothetical protein